VRIGLGCDHVGFPQKRPLLEALEQDGQATLDLGTFSADPVDYPDVARAVANAVRKGFVEAGILISESGVGAAIAANKLKGIRAAFCQDLLTARQSREVTDANLLCLDAGRIDVNTAIEITRE
jgi:ribose 5-phosphate isomerase B